ncbi:unnamed protein product [Clavelina lepadiformis]|uniref:SUEL-type lectin domain-containing protein n=1 Tax=Clavelina lepadiformis TaxID=159417 RepID=A0ABP0FA81_CLALP
MKILILAFVFLPLASALANQVKSVVICENDQATISCPKNNTLFIKYGYYGRKSNLSCPSPNTKTTNCVAKGSLQKMKKLCGHKESCQLEAENSIYGDPCKGTPKYIYVEYICQKSDSTKPAAANSTTPSKPPTKETAVICENTNKIVSCPASTHIVINSAYYGRKNNKTCPSKNINTTNCQAFGSLRKIRKLCDLKQSCELEATDSIYGNPCNGTFKYINVVYECKSGPPPPPAGKKRNVIACENHNVHVTCPKGDVIYVLDGFYGRKNAKTCPSKVNHNITCAAHNSLEKIMQTCNYKNSCVLRPINLLYGDPCIGVYKYISMNYMCLPTPLGPFKKVACQPHTLDVSCPAGKKIDVVNGYYGRLNSHTCPSFHILTTKCYAFGSSQLLAFTCDGRQSCSIKASNRFFGNPCWGTQKYLQMHYYCV